MFSRLTERYIARRLRAAYQADTFAPTDGYAQAVIAQYGKSLKNAAVLIPLAWREGEWHLLFTRRTQEVESHKGQVSFPGGARDSNETSAEQTALREAEEETGLQPTDVHILGRLNDVVTITGYRVTPVVGVIPWPYDFRLEPAEVSRVFTIPLGWLAQRQNWEEHCVTPDGAQRASPVITYSPYDGEILWGATARMTQDFLKILGLLKM